MKFERSSGVLLHPSSHPGKFGIGDLGESSYFFIDFLEKAEQSLWQVLPLNPTSFGDSPYQSFSTFAGNSLFISPEKLLKSNLLKKEDMDSIPDFPTDSVDYGPVISYKTKLYRTAYENFLNSEDSQLKKEFASFQAKNQYWLGDYTLFAALKDYFIAERKYEYETKEIKSFYKETAAFLSPNLQKDYYYGAVWSSWPEKLKKREPAEIAKWKQKLKKETGYYAFLQFEFFRQWNQLKEYAHERNIKIVGDIPIFVAFDSADVWANPALFQLNEKGYPLCVAGVPPDYFSEKGQLWGNPLYLWENHKKENYAWWISRIQNTLATVDILRIDHFRGFESYWSIPFGDEDATGGQWVKGPGRELFESIRDKLGELPIIAEDLGIITEEVSDLRLSLGFSGMKVLQFAFDDSENNQHLPHNYDKNTVVYTGTHDNDTTYGWYRKTSEQEKDLFRRYMNVDGTEPHWDLIRLASASAADLAVFPLQDILGLDSAARMNTPSVAAGNWKFRYESEALTSDKAEHLRYLTELFRRKGTKLD